MLRQHMLRLSKHFSMCLIKTWLNAWNTGTRFHDEFVLPCVFGCPGMEDSTAHYVRCPLLWRCASDCTGVPLRYPYIHNLFILSFDRRTVSNVVNVFNVYHTIRTTFHHHAVDAAMSGDFSFIQLKARALAKATARKFSQ